jgi:RND family efflux transporter MFP subunit
MNYRAIGAVAMAAALFTACRTKDVNAAKPAESTSVTAAVTRVRPEPFLSTITVTGSLVSNARVDVKAETTGRVSRFPKEEGEAVRAGEAVLWVDQENYELGVRQAESSVAVAEAAVARAKVLEAHARAELERAQNLIQSGGITDKDLKLAIVTEQDARSQTQLAEAQLQQAKTALAIARKRLRDAVVRAPVDGEIQKKFVNAGAYVEPPTPVFTLVDNSRLELEAQIAAAEIGHVRAGQTVMFSVNTYPNESFKGVVADVAPAVETDSRSAKVRIAIDNRGGKLKAGMFVQGEIQTGIRSDALVIPLSAVYRDDHLGMDASVLVVESGKAVRRKIRVGREREGRLEVLAGLAPGDLLISEQSVEIAEGVKIQPREAADVSQ